MPRNSSGVYQLPAGNPVVTGTLVESIWANATMSDIAQAVTDSLDRFGRSTMAAPLLINDGTVSAPGLAFGAEASTGLFRKSAKVLAVTLGGIEAATFTQGGMTMPLGLAPGGVIKGSGTTSGTWQLGPNNPTCNLELTVTGAAGSTGNIDINPIVADGTSQASVRIFARTNTTGSRPFQINRGDASASVDHRFFGIAPGGVGAEISRFGQRTLIGTTGDNTIDTLQIALNARVRQGASGVGSNAAAIAGYDEFVIEGAAQVGMSFLTPANSQAGIAWGRPAALAQGFILYNHATDQMHIGAAASDNLILDAAYTRSTFPFYAPDGTGLLPAYTFTSDPDTGIMHAATANTMSFVTAGAEKMRLAQYADGTLLLNTVNSLYAAAGRGDLEINGTTSALVGLNIASAGGATIGATATALTIATANNTKPIVFSPAGAESGRFTAAAQGELLINGQSALTYSAANRGLITVDGSAGSVLAMGMAGVARGYLYGGATGLMVSGAAGMVLMFGTSGIEVARVDVDSTLQYTPPPTALANSAEVGFRQMPAVINPSGTYQMIKDNRGKCIIQQAAANVIGAAAFVAGDVVSVCNKSGSPIGLVNTGITCNWGPGTPLVGNRSLANNGFATYFFTGTNIATLTGSGIS